MYIPYKKIHSNTYRFLFGGPDTDSAESKKYTLKPQYIVYILGVRGFKTNKSNARPLIIQPY